MPIYTRQGDNGWTRTSKGEKVPKSSLRVETYGTIDEANACLGLALAALREVGREEFAPWLERLRWIQEKLFAVGGAFSGADTGALPEEVALLERWIDEAEGQLPALRSFILRGGTIPGAHVHLCGTVVRRAERLAAQCFLAEQEEAARERMRGALQFLNRLSDLLFSLARLVNRRLGNEELPVRSSSPPPP